MFVFVCFSRCWDRWNNYEIAKYDLRCSHLGRCLEATRVVHFTLCYMEISETIMLRKVEGRDTHKI